MVSRRDILFGRFRKKAKPVPAAKSAPAATISWLTHGGPPTGAIAAKKPVMGKVFVDRFSCLNALGTTCSVCIERCPEEGAIAWDGRIPRINAAACTGCDVCESVCPAPNPAIVRLGINRKTGAEIGAGGDDESK